MTAFWSFNELHTKQSFLFVATHIKQKSKKWIDMIDFLNFGQSWGIFSFQGWIKKKVDIFSVVQYLLLMFNLMFH